MVGDFDDFYNIPYDYFDPLEPVNYFDALEELETMSEVKPNIGGMKGATPWTGGKPSADWTKSENNRPKTPFCFRPSVEKDAKTYDKRTGGLADKFSRDCKKYSVQAFASDVDRHMQEHGMDTVFLCER
jgi:hypothetical protein